MSKPIPLPGNYIRPLITPIFWVIISSFYNASKSRILTIIIYFKDNCKTTIIRTRRWQFPVYISWNILIIRNIYPHNTIIVPIIDVLGCNDIFGDYVLDLIHWNTTLCNRYYHIIFSGTLYSNHPFTTWQFHFLFVKKTKAIYVGLLIVYDTNKSYMKEMLTLKIKELVCGYS